MFFIFCASCCSCDFIHCMLSNVSSRVNLVLYCIVLYSVFALCPKSNLIYLYKGLNLNFLGT